MLTRKFSLYIILFFVVWTALCPVTVSAAPAGNVLNTLTASTMPTDNGQSTIGLLDKLLGFLFDKVLGPILNILGNSKPSASIPPSNSSPTTKPTVPTGPIQDSGILRGKTIVVDPGHGGSNPGAVENGTHEADNNLAVALKLRDKLSAAGAKVVMTRSYDQTVAPEGSSLGEELAARVNIAEANHADIFVSIHSNSNPDPSIAGAMTFYPQNKSDKLALEVQTSLITATSAEDKGVEPATFYVLRNTSMPSILVEMGFVSNSAEAAKLASDSYREKVAVGVYKGIISYFNRG